MPIFASASGGTEYKPAPAGSHVAVCCDVVDLGVLEVTFGGKTKKQHKVNIFWQLSEELRDDDKPFIVRKRYTLSLHEKAALRKDLEAWRGRAFSNEELDKFDLENLLSVGCYVSVVHQTKADGSGTWANVASIMKLPKGVPTPKIVDYARVCDRKEAEGEPPPPDIDTSGMGVDESDIPFAEAYGDPRMVI